MITFKSLRMAGVALSLMLALTSCETKYVTGPGPVVDGQPPTPPNTPPVPGFEITVTPSLPFAPALSSLQGGDSELAGHPVYVYGNLTAYVDASGVYVRGTITVREVNQDYSTFVSQISAQIYKASPGTEIVALRSSSSSNVPSSYSTPTSDHTIKTIPLTGDLATGVVMQLDREGKDLGYTGVVGIDFLPITLVVRRVS